MGAACALPAPCVGTLTFMTPETNSAVGLALGAGLGVRLGSHGRARVAESTCERVWPARQPAHAGNQRERKSRKRAYGSTAQPVEDFGSERRDRDRDRSPGRNPLQSRRGLACGRNLCGRRGRSVDRPQAMSQVRGRERAGANHRAVSRERCARSVQTAAGMSAVEI
jgi:hypothetical protein